MHVTSQARREEEQSKGEAEKEKRKKKRKKKGEHVRLVEQFEEGFGKGGC